MAAAAEPMEIDAPHHAQHGTRGDEAHGEDATFGTAPAAARALEMTNFLKDRSEWWNHEEHNAFLHFLEAETLRRITLYGPDAVLLAQPRDRPIPAPTPARSAARAEPGNTEENAAERDPDTPGTAGPSGPDEPAEAPAPPGATGTRGASANEESDGHAVVAATTLLPPGFPPVVVNAITSRYELYYGSGTAVAGGAVGLGEPFPEEGDRSAIEKSFFSRQKPVPSRIALEKGFADVESIKRLIFVYGKAVEGPPLVKPPPKLPGGAGARAGTPPIRPGAPIAVRPGMPARPPVAGQLPVRPMGPRPGLVGPGPRPPGVAGAPNAVARPLPPRVGSPPMPGAPPARPLGPRPPVPRPVAQTAAPTPESAAPVPVPAPVPSAVAAPAARPPQPPAPRPAIDAPPGRPIVPLIRAENLPAWAGSLKPIVAPPGTARPVARPPRPPAAPRPPKAAAVAAAGTPAAARPPAPATAPAPAGAVAGPRPPVVVARLPLPGAPPSVIVARPPPGPGRPPGTAAPKPKPGTAKVATPVAAIAAAAAAANSGNLTEPDTPTTAPGTPATPIVSEEPATSGGKRKTTETGPAAAEAPAAKKARPEPPAKPTRRSSAHETPAPVPTAPAVPAPAGIPTDWKHHLRFGQEIEVLFDEQRTYYPCRALWYAPAYLDEPNKSTEGWLLVVHAIGWATKEDAWVFLDTYGKSLIRHPGDKTGPAGTELEPVPEGKREKEAYLFDVHAPDFLDNVRGTVWEVKAGDVPAIRAGSAWYRMGYDRAANKRKFVSEKQKGKIRPKV